MLVLISDTLEGSAGSDRTFLVDVCRSTNRNVFPNHSRVVLPWARYPCLWQDSDSDSRLSPRVDDISGWETS